MATMIKDVMGEVDSGFKSGFVALIGRPNAGKSTLTNALVGEKIAITSDTPQTTRHRLQAIINRENSQIIIVDTPGIHKAIDSLGEEVNKSAFKAIEDVDVIAFLVDSSQPIGAGDRWISSFIQATKGNVKKILVLTKADIASEEAILSQVELGRELLDFDEIIAISSFESFNLEAFLDLSEDLLPEGPRWFPADMNTDQPLEVMIAEFIREKVIRATFDELPHAVGVEIDDIEQDLRANMTKIYATIYVERNSQKGIVIGKGGEGIKSIGIEARKDLEKLLLTNIFLDLRVRVKKGWRKDASQIQRFGYGEGA